MNDAYQELLEKVLTFVAYKHRTQKEVEAKVAALLRKKRFSELAAENTKTKAVAYLVDLKLVDDTAEFVRQNSLSRSPKSIAGLKNFLYKKGVPKEIIDSLGAGRTKEGELEQITKWIDRKTKVLTKYDNATAKKKLINYLMSKGFKYDLVYRAVDSKFKVN